MSVFVLDLQRGGWAKAAVVMMVFEHFPKEQIPPCGRNSYFQSSSKVLICDPCHQHQCLPKQTGTLVRSVAQKTKFRGTWTTGNLSPAIDNSYQIGDVSLDLKTTYHARLFLVDISQ